MTKIGLPVPAGFTITTEVCVHYYQNGKKYPDGLLADLAKAVSLARERNGQDSGIPRIRCWSPFAPAHEIPCLG